MKQKIIILIIVSLFLFTSISSITVIGVNTKIIGATDTINVPGDYNTIQEAVNAALPCDTIYVSEGRYKESVTIDKSLILLAENQNTIVERADDDFVFCISSDGVTINGFKIEINNKENRRAGIYLTSNNNNILNNVLIDSTFNGGICLDSSNLNTIKGNKIIEGICGIKLVNSCNNELFENSLIESNVGISIFSSSNSNTIYRNDFVYNTGIHAFDNCSNSWFKGTEGNYWSKYNGVDENSDGIGDTNYTIKDDDGNIVIQDFYPLMNTFGDTNYRPNAFLDEVEIDEDSEDYKIDVLANDKDPNGDTLTIESITQATNGNAEIRNGFIYYTPNPNFCGTDEFTYTVTDGKLTDSEKVKITILNEGNDPPSTPELLSYTERGNLGDTFSVDYKVTDPDGDEIYIKLGWDNKETDWYGPYEPNLDKAGISFSFYSKGSYDVRAKAKDTNGLESDWSEPARITVSRSKTSFTNILLKLFNQFSFLQHLLDI